MNKHTARLLEQHFDTAFAAPDGIAKLRELILTLAMQGKLVEQDPNDPPASELLKEIEAEKQRLVKAGKIKQPKPLPPIKPEEVPYKLPKGWEWVRLGDVVLSITGGGTPSKNNPAFWGGDIPWASVKDLNVETYLDSTIDSITKKAIISSSTNLIPKGSVIVCTRMGLGKIAINTVAVAINQDLKALTISSRVDQMFFFKKYKNYRIIGSGMTVHGIRQDELLNFLFPLPPLPEQHRIVARIDQLMARCDELEKLRKAREIQHLAVHAAAIKQLLDTPDGSAWAFIQQHFGELYTAKENVAELRKAILQLAVMGRLVPQDPNDPPASELLKEIEAKKQRLVKEKKIKRPKPVPSISQDDEPFQVPDNWRWVRIAELAESIDYGTSQKTCDDSSLVPVYRMGNIVDGQLIDEGFKYIAPDIDELPRLFLQLDDILFNRTNSYELVGKSALYTGPVEHATFASYLIRVRLFDALLNPVFISQAMNAPYFRSTQIEPEIVQQCGQANFNGTKLSLCAVPLPPIPEQDRIVARIGQLMALCDMLEQKIDAATVKQSELLTALLNAQPQQHAGIIDLSTYRSAIGCYVVGKLANTQYFGRTAAAKVMYLAQAHVGLTLDFHPEREAAGPLDKWIYDFERQGQRQGWFEVNEKNLASGRKKTEYRCLSTLSEPSEKAEALMSAEQQTEFDHLIYALADKKTEEVEIIATLFAVWNDFLIDGIHPTDEQIIADVRENWHERKARFSPAELGRWLDWLRSEKLVPRGWSPRTVQQTQFDL